MDHPGQNKILAKLSAPDAALITPHLVATDLPVRMVLETRNKKPTRVYFPRSGFASVVAETPPKPGIEVGIIGREGMTGLALVLGRSELAEHHTYMQSSGHGHWLPAEVLTDLIAQSRTLHAVMLSFGHDYMIQLSRSVLANGRDKVEDRLARWLLMAEDRIETKDLTLTHEFLALMLGVRRSGVTTAVQELEKKGLIDHSRGMIVIVDRAGLESLTEGTYKRDGG